MKHYTWYALLLTMSLTTLMDVHAAGDGEEAAAAPVAAAPVALKAAAPVALKATAPVSEEPAAPMASLVEETAAPDADSVVEETEAPKEDEDSGSNKKKKRKNKRKNKRNKRKTRNQRVKGRAAKHRKKCGKGQWKASSSRACLPSASVIKAWSDRAGQSSDMCSAMSPMQANGFNVIASLPVGCSNGSCAPAA